MGAVLVRPTITMKLLVVLACLLVLSSARRPGGGKGGKGGKGGRGPKGLLCSDGCKPTCADGGMPVCEDGSEPVGRRCSDRSKPSCSDGERPATCSDGSEPAKRPKPCEEGRPSAKMSPSHLVRMGHAPGKESVGMDQS